MSQKSLHRHALPIVLLGFGLLILSGLILARSQATNLSGKSLTNLLNVRLFSLKPAVNGFVHVTRYGSQNQASLNALSQNGSLGMMEDAGRVAQIDAVVNGASRP